MVIVLVCSAALNCIYFLPIVYRLWWPPSDWKPEHQVRPVALGAMVVPTVAIAALSIGAGVFAGIGLSPLGFAELITARSQP